MKTKKKATAKGKVKDRRKQDAIQLIYQRMVDRSEFPERRKGKRK